MVKQQLFDGRYKIISTLGKGGTSTVYLAQNIKLGTLWAVKQVDKKHGGKMDLLAEPNILKKLNHTALPRIFDMIEDEQFLYIIEDFVEGVSLEKELAVCGYFSEGKVLMWAVQLCDVLHYLHTFKPNPIVFRDLKPANIILTYDEQIKLIDFGVAREHKVEAAGDTTYLGTRGYAAPEQYGHAQTDARTDIYSLGITLYQLLTGIKPTVSTTSHALHDIRQINPLVSQQIEYVIFKCTRQDPKERFQTVAEVMRELQNIINQKHTLSKVPDTEVLSGITDASPQINHVSETKLSTDFKRKCIALWGNTEFAAEMSYVLGRQTNLDVWVVNLDFMAPLLQYYLEVKPLSSKDFQHIMTQITTGALKKDTLKSYCTIQPQISNVMILESEHDYLQYERYCTYHIESLMQYAYQYFDITILVVSDNILDSHTIEALRKADSIIVPIRPTMDAIQRFEYHYNYLKQKHTILMEKIKYVAYEYRKGTSPAVSDLKHQLRKEHWLGKVDYLQEREIYRNYRTPFVNHLPKSSVNEYMNILGHFGIVSKPSWQQLVGWTG